MRYLTKKNQAILREMVRTDFKIRYQGSVLGYVWALLKPLLMFAVLYIIFTYILPIGQDVEHYGVILLLGIVLWSFFAETTMVGASSVVANGDLIRKVSIPRYMVVLASSVSALINLGLSLTVVFIFALINGLTPQLSWLLLIFVIIELALLSLGIAFILAAAYVRFRDVTYIWEVILQAGFYASCIIFPMSLVPVDLRGWFFVSPIVQAVQDARNFLIGGDGTTTIWNTVDNPLILATPFAIVIMVCVVGFVYFRSRSRYFAEDI